MMDKKKENLPLSLDLLEALAKFQQIEFDDVELSFDELELRLSPGMVMSAPAIAQPQQITLTAKPTQFLEAQAGIPPGDYRGKVVEVKLGATKAGGFINLVPVFGTIFSYLLLQDIIYWTFGVGLFLVVFGIIIINFPIKKEIVDAEQK